MFGKNWDEASKLVQVITPGYNKILLSSFAYADLNDPEQAKVFIGHFPRGSSVR